MLGLLTVLLMATPMQVFATKVPGSGDQKPSTDTPSDSGGNNGSDSGGGGSGGGSSGLTEPVVPEEPKVLSYTPVVTALHSLNALLAKDGTAVYFLPSKDDFPVDLTTTCADLTSEDGKRHQFAIVYDGYFDNEVAYSQVQNANSDVDKVTRLQTSKKVYSLSDNSRCLNLVGYDLLLSNEETVVTYDGSDYSVDYVPTLVGSSPLSTKTIIMDLYKAVGAVEWDIKVFYGKDDALAVNTSPIQEQLKVLTNDEVEGGIVTSEGATYVWATRTNPDIYWERCKRDVIFDGGAHKNTRAHYVGNDVSVTFSKSEVDTMSFGEFCQVARAIMELYGEPVLTRQEIDAMIQAYALELPSVGVTEEELEAIRYLAAKGILEPSEIELTKSVTFKDIEPIILRIADKDSRLRVNTPTDLSSFMSREGYVETTVGDSKVKPVTVERIENPYAVNYYDYVVQAVDNKTNFYLSKISGNTESRHDDIEAYNGGQANIYMTDTASGNSSLTLYNALPATIGTSTMPGEALYPQATFACNKLAIRFDNGKVAKPGSGLFEYLGLMEWDGELFYHFRVDRTIEDFEVFYDYDTELEEMESIKSYEIPKVDGDHHGGVYRFDGKGQQYYTFEEANFSGTFIDDTVVKNDPYGFSDVETLTSQMYWYYVKLDEDDLNKLSNDDVFYKEDGVGEVKAGLFIDAARADSFNAIPDTPEVNARFHVVKPDAGDGLIVLIQTSQDMNTVSGNLLKGTLQKSSSNVAFYHDSTGRLFVDTEYLVKHGKISSLYWDAKTQRLSFTSGRTAMNVVIYNEINGGGSVALVGSQLNTLDGKAIIDQNAKQYVDYSLALGWNSGSLRVYKAGNTIIPVETAVNPNYNASFSTKSLFTLFPSKTVMIGYVNVTNQREGNRPIINGFTMYGTNPLASYVIVHRDNSNIDILYVLKLSKYKTTKGDVVTTSSDPDVYEQFYQDTGVRISEVPEYTLVRMEISQEATDPTDNHGFKYIKDTVKSVYGDSINDYGWVYVAPEYSSAKDAYDTWANTGSNLGNQALPIAVINTGGSKRYINLNLNTCAVSSDGDPMAIGTMPLAMHSPVAGLHGKRLGSVNKYGNVEYNGSEVADLTALHIQPAPVGVFQAAFGFSRISPATYAASYSANELFYGSSKMTINKSGQGMIQKVAVGIPDDAEVLSAYANGSSGIWVIDTASNITEAVRDVPPDIETVFADPQDLVDWEQFKFSTLVTTIDRWSSIVLIFVLNILPRIAMFIFFILIPCAMGKDTKLFHAICEKYFDIFSFLSRGKINVNTVNSKRLLFHSWVSLVFFAIIMDGQLINFIIFICRFLIVLWQH